MDIEIWDGGLQEHELEAIKKIRLAFTEGQTDNKSQNKGGSLRDQLQSKLGRNGMFPWKGYAGFRFVDSKGKEGEFDLVIVTHCNVLVIELKDWNFEPVTMDGDTWFKGEKNMGRSPVSITRSKKYTLENKLKKLTHRFTNKGYAPHVYFFVVMTGNADFSQLPEVELQHTISLEDFLKYSNQGRFNGHFRPHPHSQVLNKDFSIFNELFLGGNTAPKSLRIGGYTAVEEIFEHPKLVYKEYLASSEISKGTEALLRVWNFKNIQGNKGITPEGRAQIVSREREVLQFINHQSRDLYNHCLRSLTSFEKDEVTSQYSEVYELPPGHVRFNEFIGKYGQLLTPGDRLNLVKLLVAKFGDLHDLKIAHRDIADHSLWLSPSKEIALSNFITAYHQPAGTVGDYRSNLSVGAAEVKEMLGSSVLNPFEQDVHALGVVSWHLLTAKRMSPKSLEGLEADILSSSEWYAGLLLDAVGGKFKDGASFFDGLKQAEPQVESLPTFDDSELHPYRRPINHSRQYREDGDFIRETGDREVYLSGGRLVKAWLNVGSEGGDLVSNFHVLSFLKKLDKLVDVNPTCLPKIYEYGLATKSGSMFLVMEQVDGETWNEAHLEQSEKQEIIEKLVGAVEHIHELGISHGDLHPENVMIGRQDRNVYLIDIPDFSRNLEEVKNHRYSPENIDSCSAFERDIFAVLKMSSEQINLEWGGESQEFPSLAEAIRTELDDTEFGFRDLGRFKKALKQTTAAQEKKCVEIELSNLDEALTILPDNGRLFVKLKASRKDASEVSVTFSGIGGTFTAFYNKDQRCFVSGKFPRARTNVNPRDEQESQFEIGTSLSIKPGKPSQLIELSEYLRYDEAFNRAIDVLEQVETAPDQSELSLQLKEAFEVVDHSGVEGGAGVALEISGIRI
ncbi:hypothetical protein E5C31_08885 [Providencia rettgeri]|nr:hypothetical protein [Providencia rettgeri]